MLTLRPGDITQSNAGIICHQVNCRGVMGAGLAKALRAKYPIYEPYVQLCHGVKAETLLGSTQFVQVSQDPERYVANCFGQCNFGRDRVQTDYAALEHSLRNVEEFARRHTLSVAIPYGIGCGLAGGDWNTVQAILEDIFVNSPVQARVFHI